MTDWKAISHAYGDASNIPGLIEQLSTDSSDAALHELWGCLCHQGTVYAASYAALAPLAVVAESMPPSQRLSLLSLAGAIVASDDLVGLDHRPLDLIEPILPRLQRLTDESMWSSTVDATSFIYLLEAASAFRGDIFWGRHLSHLADGEFPGRCPVCDYDLYLVIGNHGCFTTAQDSAKPHDAKSKRVPIAPAPPATLSGWAAWLHDAATQYHQPEVASWSRSVFGTTECPVCGNRFDVAQAIARVYPPKQNAASEQQPARSDRS